MELVPKFWFSISVDLKRGGKEKEYEERENMKDISMEKPNWGGVVERVGS
ncbi:hypothetical protein Dimus_037953 [Dionaea muscipula]